MPDELLHGESRAIRRRKRKNHAFLSSSEKQTGSAEQKGQQLCRRLHWWEVDGNDPWITVLRDSYSSYLASMALSEAAILTSPTEKPLKRGNKCPAEFSNSHFTGERKWPQLSFYYAQSKTNFVWALVCKVALIEKQMSAEDRKYAQIVKIQSTRK